MHFGDEHAIKHMGERTMTWKEITFNRIRLEKREGRRERVRLTQVVTEPSNLDTQDVSTGDEELRLSLIQLLDQPTC